MVPDIGFRPPGPQGSVRSSLGTCAGLTGCRAGVGGYGGQDWTGNVNADSVVCQVHVKIRVFNICFMSPGNTPYA